MPIVHGLHILSDAFHCSLTEKEAIAGLLQAFSDGELDIGEETDGRKCAQFVWLLVLLP